MASTIDSKHTSKENEDDVVLVSSGGSSNSDLIPSSPDRSIGCVISTGDSSNINLTASTTTGATSPSSPPAALYQQHRVKFVPFASTIESPFWVRYNQMKLEMIQLSEDPITIEATYGLEATSTMSKELGAGQTPRLQCQEASLFAPVAKLSSTKNESSAPSAATTPQHGVVVAETARLVSSSTKPALVANERVHAKGILMGYNTVESFQSVDKNKLLKDCFLDGFRTGEVNALTMFVLLTFADLKNHKVLYWFGFPALSAPILFHPFTPQRQQPQTWSSLYTTQERLDMARQVVSMRRQILATGASCPDDRAVGLPPYFVWFPSRKVCLPLSVSVLAAAEAGRYNVTDPHQVVFAFFDPNSASTDPGWPLRNLVAFLSFHLGLGGQAVNILCYRPGRLRRVVSVNNLSEKSNTDDEDMVLVELDHVHDQSLFMQILAPTKTEFGWIHPHDETAEDNSNSETYSKVKVAGWELNPRGKPGPRSVHLRPLLDASHLAIQAADLNLQLMKWRMIPNLQVRKLQATKVLLLGAGTLGCNVARVLLGWGIRSFTFVDYGNVGYSNPVRQPLFNLQDCQSNNGNGKPKAVAAADALKLIAADVQAQGIVLSIPMPGHIESKEVLQGSVTRLDRLIQECDVVFLLTDTRESRWLPTVIAAAHQKPLLNAALGLDSWLVMRHGGGEEGGGQRLGCYFCNDVVAPENSTKNRTLDQQCTVTRPGLAPIASSMAVELMVALLHHPRGLKAPAPNSSSSIFSPTVQHQLPDGEAAGSAGGDGLGNTSTTDLGILPHQIRGSLVTYTMMTPTVPAFTHCTGCAKAVIGAYLADPIDLVYQTCASPTQEYLEDLVGLTEFRAQASAQMNDLLMMCDDEDDEIWGRDDT
ncbi:hypothetical protein ACA910_022555 [Epithemia clementina (nom. ined.)]